MRELGWTWEALQATPEELVAEILDQMREGTWPWRWQTVSLVPRG